MKPRFPSALIPLPFHEGSNSSNPYPKSYIPENKKEEKAPRNPYQWPKRLVQIRGRGKRYLGEKITVTLKKLKEWMVRNLSKIFNRNQSRELEEMGRACREVNDDLCHHYYEDIQAMEPQELQIECTENI